MVPAGAGRVEADEGTAAVTSAPRASTPTAMKRGSEERFIQFSSVVAIVTSLVRSPPTFVRRVLTIRCVTMGPMPDMEET
jgi:hypothetical protein